MKTLPLFKIRLKNVQSWTQIHQEVKKRKLSQ